MCAQTYIRKLEDLLPHAYYSPEGPQAAELSMLVTMRVRLAACCPPCPACRQSVPVPLHLLQQCHCCAWRLLSSGSQSSCCDLMCLEQGTPEQLCLMTLVLQMGIAALCMLALQCSVPAKLRLSWAEGCACTQRSSEARRAMYVQLHSVLLAWNIDRACRLPHSEWPTPAVWQHVLVQPALPWLYGACTCWPASAQLGCNKFFNCLRSFAW